MDKKRWVVAAAGLICVLGPGALYSFSLTSAPLAAAFGWRPSEITWAFAIANAFLAVGGLSGGIASDRFGPRYVAATGIVLWAAGFALCGTLAHWHSLVAFYVFYGVIAGLGCGIAYISALSAVLKWFPTRRGFGGGLVIMGFGLGSFVYNLLVKRTDAFASVTTSAQAFATAQAAALAQHVPFEVQNSLMPPSAVAQLMGIFTFSGVVFAVIGIAAAFFIAVPAEEIATEPQFTLGETLGETRFYVLWAMLFLNIFGGVTIISNLVSLVRELTGMQVAAAAGLTAYLALFNGFGRLAWGWISDRLSRRVTFALLFSGQAMAFFALDATKDTTVDIVAVAVLLFCYGGGFGVMPAFNADFFGTKHFGANYGAQLSAWGLAAVFGTAFISTMKAMSGSFVGLMQPISIVLMVAIFFPLIIESPGKKVRANEASPSA